jgi:hypothetical protein
MKKLTFFIIFLVIIIHSQFAQELISSSGESIKNSDVQVDYSIGEIMIDTYSGDEIIITQGLHQPVITITDITDNKIKNMDIKLYPNPTSSILNIELNDIQKEKYYSLTDINGKLLFKDKILNMTESLDISNLLSGVYILKLTTNAQIIKSYKIIKK